MVGEGVTKAVKPPSCLDGALALRGLVVSPSVTSSLERSCRRSPYHQSGNPCCSFAWRCFTDCFIREKQRERCRHHALARLWLCGGRRAHVRPVEETERAWRGLQIRGDSFLAERAVSARQGAHGLCVLRRVTGARARGDASAVGAILVYKAVNKAAPSKGVARVATLVLRRPSAAPL